MTGEFFRRARSTLMPYSLQEAVDVLDAIASGVTPSRSAIVHGAVALALRARKDDPDVAAILVKLEQLVFARSESIAEDLRQSAAQLASTLRRASGVR
jgi:hypothetical protein